MKNVCGIPFKPTSNRRTTKDKTIFLSCQSGKKSCMNLTSCHLDKTTMTSTKQNSCKFTIFKLFLCRMPIFQNVLPLYTLIMMWAPLTCLARSQTRQTQHIQLLSKTMVTIAIKTWLGVDGRVIGYMTKNQVTLENLY